MVYYHIRQSKVGKISRVTFNNAVKTLFEEGFYKNEEVDIVYKGVKNYLAAAGKNIKIKIIVRAKLNNSVFFKALFNIFNDVLDKSLQTNGDLKRKIIRKNFRTNHSIKL